MFLPTTSEEIKKLGWKQLDIILITGDAYVDHPSFGVALIGHYLFSKGYKVGIIAQPDWNSDKDIKRLGRPKLFFGITAGNVDSMVANYTASMKKRKIDDYTPGGTSGKRPDRATIVYSNLAKRFFPNVPVILGGLEASLRRFAHYDWWVNRVRKSVLIDSKADLLVYGMAEKTILRISQILEKYADLDRCKQLPGVVWWTSRKPESGIELPSFEEISEDKIKYAEAVKLQLSSTDHLKNVVLYQKQDNRYIVQNPPEKPLDQTELDNLYLMDFERKTHPYYESMGHVPAIETVQFSITSVRGCFGRCSFCALSCHQTAHVVSRSDESIIEEARKITRHPDFKGIITDVGGPTANMYGTSCNVRDSKGTCRKFCLHPEICSSTQMNHAKYIDLLEKLRQIKGVRHVFVSSGIRHDLALSDPEGEYFIKELVNYTPGQLKLAPEHAHPYVLKLMRKPPVELFLEFKRKFEKHARHQGKNRYVIGYFIVAHPGETLRENNYLKNFINEKLGYHPQQIQIFTPSPGTISTAMYYSGIDPFTHERIHVEKSLKVRNQMKKNLFK